MCYACREVEGTPEPAMHIQRKVVCLFKQETSEGGEMPLWKRGRNPTTRHTKKASQPASYIYRWPATIASLWSEGLVVPTDPLSDWVACLGCTLMPRRPLIHDRRL